MERFLPRLRVPSIRLWATLMLMLVSLVTFAQAPFITTWKTDNPGESITIPVNNDVVTGYNYTVNWGDGNTDAGQTGDAIHTYANAGTHTIEITGDFPAIQLGSHGIDVTDKLMSIEQWGDMAWTSMESAFSGARNMVLNAPDAPNLSGVSSLESMFDGASSLNSDLSGWDVSSITDMRLMFNGASAFNGNITGWNVANVTNMYGMFWYAGAFNQNIGGWTVSQVENMGYMFYSAAAFNQDLSGWTVSNVTNMAGMFAFAMDFDQSLGSWDISGVTDMDDMLLSTGLSSANYGATLIGWAGLSTVPSSVTLDATGQEYCPGTPAAEARRVLDEDKQWTITGDSEDPACSVSLECEAFSLPLCENFDNAPIGNQNTPTVPSCWSFIDGGQGYGYVTTSGDFFLYNSYDGTDYMLVSPEIPSLGSGNNKIQFDADANIGYQLIVGTMSDPTDATTFTSIETVILTSSDYDTYSVDIPSGTDSYIAIKHGNLGAYRSFAIDNICIEAVDVSHAFITVWKTDNPGTSGPDQVTIPAKGEFTYTWVDVNNASSTGSGIGNDETTITFPQAGTYEVRIAPTGGTPFHEIKFFQFSGSDKNKLLEVKNWGDIHWTRFQFNDCANLKITATDLPDLSNVTDLSFAFSHSGIDAVPNINDWDVSNVTNMGNLFESVNDFNQPLDKWDVSNVTEMGFMFDSALTFNQALDMWDVSKVVNISYMFRDAISFNQPLGDWNLESIEGGVGFIIRTSMSCENYSQTLYGWATNPNTKGDITFDAYNVTYSPDVVPYRDYLIETLNWRFQSDDEVGTCSFTLPDPPLTPGAGNILYVDINVNTTASGYTGAGDTWTNAIPELADALKWAREQHDGGSPDWTETEPLRVFVAKGEYKPLYNAADDAYTTDGGRDNSFVLVHNVQVYGGFDLASGVETLEDARILPNHDGNATAGSILNGDLNGDDATNTPIADLPAHPSRQDNAYRVVRSVEDVGNALMDGFTITGGSSGPERIGYGGGLFVSQSSPMLSNLFITNNSVAYSGGGIYVSKSSSAISNVIISNNFAYSGAGMYTSEVVALTLTNVTITNNVASSSGGGIEHFNLHPDNLVLTNTTIAGNTPDAVYAWDPISGNNVIVWGGLVSKDGQDPGYGFKNSLVEGNTSTADGNIDATGITALDIFTDAANGDYTLKENGPAIDAGDNSHFAGLDGDTKDVVGNPRLVGSTIDMGAYEYQGEPVPTIMLLTAPEVVEVAYGTALEDVADLPTVVTASLSDDTEVSVALDNNLDNWALVTPTSGTYNGNVAGTYVFAVPLMLPEEGDIPYFTNPESVEAEVTIVVAKGIPALAALWNGTTIDVVEGLSLTYGNSGTLAFSTTDPEGAVTYALGADDPAILDMSDLDAVAAQQAGTATLTLQQEETDNFEAASVAIAVTVVQKAITIVPAADDQGKVYGADEPTEYRYELGADDALTFDDELTDIVSSASREAGENVGTYAIELAFDGTKAANYTITFETANNAFEITPLQIAITAPDKSKVFGAADPALTYTFTPELIGDDAFTGALTREEGENVGTYAIMQGTLSLDGNYEITFEAGTLTITSAAYEDVEFNDGSFVYDGEEHALELTGELPEGVTVSYGIDGDAGNSATDVGVYEITALIDGGDNYQDAELTATLTITALDIAVTAQDKTKVFGSDDPALTYTFTPELIGDDAFTGALTREEGENVGTYAITQGTLSLDGNYEITFEARTLTITSAAYEGIEFNNGSFVYDGEEHALELTGKLPEGVTVSYEIDGGAGNGATDVGVYEITALIDGGDNYQDAELTATLTITPLEITVNAEDKSKVFGTDDPALTYTFTLELIGDDAFTGALIRGEGENVGRYAITQGTLSLDDNYEITFEAGTLTITSAAYEGVEFNNGSFVYDGEEHALELTGELPEGVTVSYEIDGEAGNGATDAGVYEITALINGGDNYEDTDLTATLTITPLEITVTAADKTKAFGTDDPALTYTFTPELIGDDAFAGGPDRAEGEDVGAYAITQGTLSLGANYENTFEEGTLTVTPSQITGITFNSTSSTYDGTEHRLTLAGDLPAGASVTYEIDGEPGNGATDAGTYTITAIIDGGDNYEDAKLTATLTITPLEITVTATDRTKAFGTEDPALTYTFTPELIGADEFTGGLVREEGEDVGTYAITQGNLSLGDNYAISFEQGTLTITSAGYGDVELDDLTVTYDGTEHVIELTGELPTGITVTYGIDGEPGNGATDAGTYEVKAIIDGGQNYEDGEVTATLTITPAQITGITLNNTSFTYDGTEHRLTLAGDLPAGASVTYENNSRTDVGSQTVQAVIDGDGNYQDEVLKATLTILPAERTLDFAALPEKTYGDADFDAGAETSSGEPISYTSSNPNVAEVTDDGEITITGAGAATITATVPENANYSSRPQVSQPLTVSKASQTITLDGPVEVNRDAGSIDLTASSTSGLPVVLTADNPEVATLEGTALEILRLGRVTITATQAGDANHEAAEPVTVTIRVIDPTSDLPVRVHPVISPNGDGINEFLMIEAIKDYPENRVTLFNRNGTLLWEASGYDNNRVAFRGMSTGQLLLPAGTYFYIVEVKDGNTWKHKKGYFVLRY